MRPDQFLNLAADLLRAYPIPAGFRSAVSRAYYAVHHHIKAFVESAGVPIEHGPNAHADVWNHLANTGDSELESVSRSLSRLRSDRNEADYDLSKPRLEND